MNSNQNQQPPFKQKQTTESQTTESQTTESQTTGTRTTGTRTTGSQTTKSQNSKSQNPKPQSFFAFGGDSRMQGLTPLILALIFLPLFGALAFMIVEGWSFSDSLWMAVITLTTVGYGEVHELSDSGRLVTVAYMILGLGSFFYALSHLGEVILRGELKVLLGSRRMDQSIRSMKGHHIICGFGRMGKNLAEQLHSTGDSFLVIEREDAAIKSLQELGWPHLQADATEDASLEKAQIHNASGLAATLPTDADNLYVVLGARIINPKLRILSRATYPNSVSKLKRAGADRVVSIYEAGAVRMAHLLTNPKLVDFMEVLGTSGKSFDLAQIRVSSSAPYCEKKLTETTFRKDGIIIVGILKESGEMHLPPDPTEVIARGDTLLAVGSAAKVAEMLAD